MARPNRLNETDHPIIDFGIADKGHKLIIPQNTTANLADLVNQVGSLAYDTTKAALVVNSGSGFTSTVPSTTVAPGSYTSANITVNQQGQITAATNGSAPFPYINPVTVVGSGTYTAQATDLYILCNTTSGTVTIDLPAAIDGT